MAVPVLTIRVGEHLMGLDFTLVEQIETLRGHEGAARPRSVAMRAGDEILPMTDLREVFGQPVEGACVHVWSATRRVWVADEALEVVDCEPGDLYPVPGYLFTGRRPFRGIFPYGERWGLLLEEEAV